MRMKRLAVNAALVFAMASMGMAQQVTSPLPCPTAPTKAACTGCVSTVAVGPQEAPKAKTAAGNCAACPATTKAASSDCTGCVSTVAVGAQEAKKSKASTESCCDAGPHTTAVQEKPAASPRTATITVRSAEGTPAVEAVEVELEDLGTQEKPGKPVEGRVTQRWTTTRTRDGVVELQEAPASRPTGPAVKRRIRLTPDQPKAEGKSGAPYTFFTLTDSDENEGEKEVEIEIQEAKKKAPAKGTFFLSRNGDGNFAVIVPDSEPHHGNAQKNDVFRITPQGAMEGNLPPMAMQWMPGLPPLGVESNEGTPHVEVYVDGVRVYSNKALPSSKESKKQKGSKHKDKAPKNRRKGDGAKAPRPPAPPMMRWNTLPPSAPAVPARPGHNAPRPGVRFRVAPPATEHQDADDDDDDDDDDDEDEEHHHENVKPGEKSGHKYALKWSTKKPGEGEVIELKDLELKLAPENKVLRWSTKKPARDRIVERENSKPKENREVGKDQVRSLLLKRLQQGSSASGAKVTPSREAQPEPKVESQSAAPSRRSTPKQGADMVRLRKQLELLHRQIDALEHRLGDLGERRKK